MYTLCIKFIPSAQLCFLTMHPARRNNRQTVHPHDYRPISGCSSPNKFRIKDHSQPPGIIEFGNIMMIDITYSAPCPTHTHTHFLNGYVFIAHFIGGWLDVWPSPKGYSPGAGFISLSSLSRRVLLPPNQPPKAPSPPHPPHQQPPHPPHFSSFFSLSRLREDRKMHSHSC